MTLNTQVQVPVEREFPEPPNPFAELALAAREVGILAERFRIATLIGQLPIAPCFCDKDDLALFGKHDPTCLREAELHFRNRVRAAVFSEAPTVSEPEQSAVGVTPFGDGTSGSLTAAAIK